MPITRDQNRGRHAYECVGQLKEPDRADYKILVNSFGPNVVRSGLAAAVAFVERDRAKRKAAGLFLKDLANADIPGIPKTAGEELSPIVQSLDVDDYMLATRETLRVIVWLKRAVQASSTSD